MIDLHVHILPGLDDGAGSWDEFLAMARACVEDGVHTVVATPHMLPDGAYANRAADVRPRAEEARERLARAQVPLELCAGGELYIAPRLAEDVEAGHLLACPDGGRHALVELPAREVPAHAEEVFFRFQVKGITPILAHPERYLAVAPHLLTRLEEWVGRGVLLQVNARSLLGESGSRVLRAAEDLVARHMVHFLASDAHGCRRRPPGLAAARRRVEELAGAAFADALVRENPRRVLAGEHVPVWEIKKPPQRTFLSRLLRRA